jgi:hypothetical protein
LLGANAWQQPRQLQSIRSCGKSLDHPTERPGTLRISFRKLKLNRAAKQSHCGKDEALKINTHGAQWGVTPLQSRQNRRIKDIEPWMRTARNRLWPGARFRHNNHISPPEIVKFFNMKESECGNFTNSRVIRTAGPYELRLSIAASSS